MARFDLSFPETVEEACQALAQDGSDGRIVAGGVALMILVKHGLYRPRRLISLKRIRGLAGVQETEGGGVRLGAMATHHEVELSPVVHRRAPVLAEATAHVANLRIRNMGTLVGDLCHADNHSDPAPVLLVLDARARAVSARGSREVPFAQFFVDTYQTVLAEDELLTEVFIPPAPPRLAGCYVRFSGHSSIDWPTLGAACMLRLGEDARVQEARLALGSVTAVPQRLPEIEAMLVGQALTADLMTEAGRRAARLVDPPADARGSTWYKKRMVEVFVRRALEETLRRARANGVQIP
ncbi:MAG: xanthine dehydrogenase family protein subunit M [Deltaproteobacteria bacterium]|nr:xanthine dehydrogenase family protein subunit M [Deltaproteobacteria bacterium]